MAVELFISYHEADEEHLRELEKVLRPLERGAAKPSLWHRGLARAGEEVEALAARRFETARVIVLLLSNDYLAEDRLYDEATLAAQRQREGSARVVPVVVRPCNLEETALDGLATLPKGAGAIATAVSKDDAWTRVASETGAVLKEAAAQAQAQPPTPVAASAEPRYRDDATRELGRRLQAALRRRDQLLDEGRNDPALVQEILDLKRRLREEGQLKAGDVLGERQYRLIERIGKGGFADVWRAQMGEEGREVAVKVLHANLAGDPARAERFFRGARAMARLRHPGIVRILEQHGEDRGWYYFVMELVPGKDLHRAVLGGAVRRERVGDIILTVGEALSEAHRKGMVHRDVKPANILLDEAGTAKLTDFDLVALDDSTGGTRTGAMGTVFFAAPELLDKPQEADARADVYGLGMTAMFCWHGRALPPNVMWAPEKVLDVLPCGAQVRDVLRKAIVKEASGRYESMTAFCFSLRWATLLQREMGLGGGLRHAVAESIQQPRMGRRTGPLKVESWSPIFTGNDGVSAVEGTWTLPWRADPMTATAQSPFAEQGRFRCEVSLDEEGRPKQRTVSIHSDFFETLVPWVDIPAGEFLMGSPEDDKEADKDELPQHRMSVDAFSLSRTPVTVGQYAAVMGKDLGDADPNLPVTKVSWLDALDFCNALSRLAGREPCYVRDEDKVTWNRGADGFRLPTEAEWEYACRAGTTTRYSFDDDPDLLGDHAWFAGNSKNQALPVGQKRPNPWGLHDMHGNVWEWVWDVYGTYEQVVTSDKDKVTNGKVTIVTSPLVGGRVVRGGSFWSGPGWLRSAYRDRSRPGNRFRYLGFRCAASARRQR